MQPKIGWRLLVSHPSSLSGVSLSSSTVKTPFEGRSCNEANSVRGLMPNQTRMRVDCYACIIVFKLQVDENFTGARTLKRALFLLPILVTFTVTNVNITRAQSDKKLAAVQREVREVFDKWSTTLQSW